MPLCSLMTSNTRQMPATMDIVICLDCTSSITSYFRKILQTIDSILNSVAIMQDQSDIRMALIEFRSHYDRFLTNTHPFTQSISTFRQELKNVRPEEDGRDAAEAIGKKHDSDSLFRQNISSSF